jgi:hypothetical protein
METIVSTFVVALAAVASYKYFTVLESVKAKPNSDAITHNLSHPSTCLMVRDGNKCESMEVISPAAQYSILTGQSRGVRPPACVCTNETGSRIVCYLPTTPGSYIGAQ